MLTEAVPVPAVFVTMHMYVATSTMVMEGNVRVGVVTGSGVDVFKLVHENV